MTNEIKYTVLTNEIKYTCLFLNEDNSITVHHKLGK